MGKIDACFPQNPKMFTLKRSIPKLFVYLQKQKTLDFSNKIKCFLYGRSGEIRTRGLLNPIQARYQAALHPDGT